MLDMLLAYVWFSSDLPRKYLPHPFELLLNYRPTINPQLNNESFMDSKLRY
jgi:hypothetical protein